MASLASDASSTEMPASGCEWMMLLWCETLALVTGQRSSGSEGSAGWAGGRTVAVAPITGQTAAIVFVGWVYENGVCWVFEVLNRWYSKLREG